MKVFLVYNEWTLYNGEGSVVKDLITPWRNIKLRIYTLGESNGYIRTFESVQIVYVFLAGNKYFEYLIYTILGVSFREYWTTWFSDFKLIFMWSKGRKFTIILCIFSVFI